MSFFNPELPKKEKIISHHPWEKTIKYAYSGTYKYGHNSANNPVYPPRKVTDNKDRLKFTVIGNFVTKEFIFCYYLVKLLHKYRQKQFEAPLIRGVTSVEWQRAWNELKLQFGACAFCIDSVVVMVNDKFLGGEKELKKFVGSKYIFHLCRDYYKEGIQQFANYIKSSGRPCAYMQISIDGKEIGTMIFMLYADIVPLTCENFLRLCETTRGGYAGTPVHRIVEDGWIQCGGFGLEDNPSLNCENFIVQHDRRGVICMANDNRHVDCSTQFFVLLQPAPWMAHKYVAFGQLIEGEATLRKIESVPTWYESPTADIKIYKAGIFNMDCHWIPINKNTHEYIHSHIENLIEIGEIFYKELLQRVFLEIQFRYLQGLKSPEVKFGEEGEMVENDMQDIHATKRFIRKKNEIGNGVNEGKKLTSGTDPSTSVSSASAENKDFDVEEYIYEFEEYAYPKISAPSEVQVKPEKPFYIPLTDVPYPGEVESIPNIRKLLKGDMCHETDLMEDPAKRTQQQHRRMSVPEALISALFDCFEDDDISSESSLDSDDQNEIRDYLKENGDSASFAGQVIKKVANIRQRYAIFDEINSQVPIQHILSDDELRIIRMAEFEMQHMKQKHVSISLSASKLSHMKIQRRATGFIRMSDLAVIYGIDDDFESLEEEVDSDEDVKKVRIVTDAASETHRSTVYGPQGDAPRPSVLARLYVDVTRGDDDDDARPTLKDFKPFSEQKSITYLTKTDTKYLLEDDTGDKMMYRQDFNPPKSIDHVLSLQYGNRISRKISYDYVGTIRRMEHKPVVSIRSLEFEKSRPSISVVEYKEKNREYHEQLNATSKTMPEVNQRTT